MLKKKSDKTARKDKRMSIAKYQRRSVQSSFLWNIAIASFICAFVLLLIGIHHMSIGFAIAILSCILVGLISAIITWRMIKSLHDENIPN